MTHMQKNASPDLAKDYLSKRKIPELFEVKFKNEKRQNSFLFFQALITGLMIHKPDDHVEFIMESLSRVS